jgi:hypothetical protein
MSSLAHAAVHVNICSSMTVDGAMFDRPQVCPLFLPGGDRRLRRVHRNFVRQEHWLPIERSGGLARADDADELIEEISLGLTDPARRAAGRRRLVEAVITADDGRAGARWIEQVDELLAGRPGTARAGGAVAGDRAAV